MTLIDPRQYTPYELIFPSGNLNATQGDDYFNIYLLNSLSGNFNITGGLSLNGQPVFAPGTTNNFGGTNSYVFGGTNNFVTGTNNSIIYAFSSEVSGEGSAILFGEQNQVLTGYYSSILAGRNTLVSHTGAVVIGDSVLARQKNSVRNDSFNIDLTGGTFNQYELFQKGNFYLDSSASGLVSGNWNFDGNVYKTGSPLQNLQNLKDASGHLMSSITLNSGVAQTGRDLLSGQIGSTGSNLLNLIRINSGIASSGLLTGVANETYVTAGAVGLPSTINLTNKTAFILPVSATPTISPNGAIALDTSVTNWTAGLLKYGAGGGSFGVLSMTEAEMSSPGDRGFVTYNATSDKLNFSNLIMTNYRPSAYNSSGVSGQMAFLSPYLYLCTGTNAWGRVAVAAW